MGKVRTGHSDCIDCLGGGYILIVDMPDVVGV